MGNLIANIVFFSFLIEGAIENIFSSIPEQWKVVIESYSAFMKRVVGILGGILIAIGFNLDAFTELGMPAVQVWIAQLVTGIVIGLGSQFMHDLLNRYARK